MMIAIYGGLCLFLAPVLYVCPFRISTVPGANPIKIQVWCIVLPALAIVTVGIARILVPDSRKQPKVAESGAELNQMDHNLHVGLVLAECKLVRTVQSPFHKIEVLEHPGMGKVLVIDGDLQLTQFHEKAYHEMLSHVPLQLCSKPKRVLVVGGGDGGAATECLRYNSVTEIVVVDIDEQVSVVCREHFAEMSSALGNSSVRLVHEDGAAWVARSIRDPAERFDAVIVDSMNPLFTDQFWQGLQRLLRAGGVVVSNLTSLSWNTDAEQRLARCAAIFKHVGVYQMHQPTRVSGQSGFVICSDTVGCWAPEELECSIDCDANRYYNLEVHRAAFVLPNALHQLVKQTILCNNSK